MTIAKWVGHDDGGKLIGKVYGHLRPEHSREMACRVLIPDAMAPDGKPKTEPISERTADGYTKTSMQKTTPSTGITIDGVYCTLERLQQIVAAGIAALGAAAAATG